MNLVNNSLLCGDIVFLCFYLFVLILCVSVSLSTLLRSSALYWLHRYGLNCVFWFCEHYHYFILLLLLLYYLLPCHGEIKLIIAEFPDKGWTKNSIDRQAVGEVEKVRNSRQC